MENETKVMNKKSPRKWIYFGCAVLSVLLLGLVLGLTPFNLKLFGQDYGNPYNGLTKIIANFDFYNSETEMIRAVFSMLAISFLVITEIVGVIFLIINLIRSLKILEKNEEESLISLRKTLRGVSKFLGLNLIVSFLLVCFGSSNATFIIDVVVLLAMFVGSNALKVIDEGKENLLTNILSAVPYLVISILMIVTIHNNKYFIELLGIMEFAVETGTGFKTPVIFALIGLFGVILVTIFACDILRRIAGYHPANLKGKNFKEGYIQKRVLKDSIILLVFAIFADICAKQSNAINLASDRVFTILLVPILTLVISILSLFGFKMDNKKEKKE